MLALCYNTVVSQPAPSTPESVISTYSTLTLKKMKHLEPITPYKVSGSFKCVHLHIVNTFVSTEEEQEFTAQGYLKHDLRVVIPSLAGSQ